MGAKTDERSKRIMQSNDTQTTSPDLKVRYRELSSEFERKRAEWTSAERILIRTLLRISEGFGRFDPELARELEVLRNNLSENGRAGQFSGLIQRVGERCATILSRRIPSTAPLSEPFEQLLDALVNSPALGHGIAAIRTRLRAGDDPQQLVDELVALINTPPPSGEPAETTTAVDLMLQLTGQLKIPGEFENRRNALRIALAQGELNDPISEVTGLLGDVQVHLGRDAKLLAAFLKRASQYLSLIDTQLKVTLDHSRSAANDSDILSRSISAGLETLDAIMQSESPDIQAHAKLEDSLNTVRLSLDSFLEMQQRQRQDYEQRIAELTNQVSSFELESARLRESLAAEHARAHRDTLTDTPNRLAYEERAELEIMRARRNDSPLCLAVFDLDHFKLVNDRFGHRVGDRLLRSVASIATQRVRGTDLFARYGGEEFVGVFPDSCLEDVAALCDDLRERIASAAFQFRGEVIPMTVSIGLSALHPDDSLGSLFERADAALYRAKEAGRNRLVREA